MLLKSVEKHSEFTYGVHHTVVNEVAADNAFTLLYPTPMEQALRTLDKGVMGARRSLIVKMCLLRQAIAYGLGYKVERDGEGFRLLFAVYKRLSKNTEVGLRDVLSLGGGGHIEGDDLSYHVFSEDGSEENIKPTSSIDLLETLDDSFTREYHEEFKLMDVHGNDLTEALLGVNSVKGYNKIGFVMDSKPSHDYVGNTHFGVVYAVEISDEALRFEMREPQNEAIGWATVEDLLDVNSDVNKMGAFEPWSQFLINDIRDIEAYILDVFHDVKVAVPMTPARLRDTLEMICNEAWEAAAKEKVETLDEVCVIANSKIMTRSFDLLSEHLEKFESVTAIPDNGQIQTVVDVTFKGKAYTLTVVHPQVDKNTPGVF